MKLFKTFAWIAAILLVATSCTKKVSLEGTWYGLYNKSLATITLGADSIMDLRSESFSQMTKHGKYSINTRTNPMHTW